jgi:hypothetical protein
VSHGFLVENIFGKSIPCKFVSSSCFCLSYGFSQLNSIHIFHTC